MIIAIDGPAGAGKGTLGKRLATVLNFAYLDTGLLYRSVGAALVAGGHALDDVEAAAAIARNLKPGMVRDRPELRTEATGAAASAVAAMDAVRAALLEFQRSFAAHPPGGMPGAILDGRDIGTVICPDADMKLYITATAAARAQRRFQELRDKGEPSIYAEILKDVEDRDQRDSSRATAPLKPARDAITIDTTNLDAESVFAQVMELVRQRQLDKQNRC